MSEKLSKAYTSLVVTIDTEWISYTSANLWKTIYKISQFLKADLLKVFYVSNILVSSYSNKHPCLNSNNSVLPAYSHFICLSERLYHSIDKYWELHPKQRPANQQKKIGLSDMKIKRIASSVVKDDTSTFNINWLSKVLAAIIPSSKKNLWLFDFTTHVCVCNDQNMFLDFVEGTTTLSRVTA